VNISLFIQEIRAGALARIISASLRPSLTGGDADDLAIAHSKHYPARIGGTLHHSENMATASG